MLLRTFDVRVFFFVRVGHQLSTTKIIKVSIETISNIRTTFQTWHARSKESHYIYGGPQNGTLLLQLHSFVD